ncbi:MAG: 16S rRNA (cytidine(1402)-2'-O)-methyltransferase [Fidelibacterota bacterium]
MVATPIGNLKDITLRAIETLKAVDLVVAEDTRRTRKLLTHFEIRVPLLSYFEHNREQRIPAIIGKLEGGSDVALVTDAGTPGISDPAYRLIRAALKKGIAVTSVPGPSAVTTAVVQSGLPTDRFVFEGFLPRKKGRSSRLSKLARDDRTIVIFESAERLVKTLADCGEHMGNRPVSVCRELTKMHEEVYRGTLSDAEEYFRRSTPRGEIVIVIGKDDPNVYFEKRSGAATEETR